MAFAAGELDLPAGVKFEDLSWRWVHRGLPWWNPEQEANGNIAAIQAGFDNYENVTLQNGTWIEDNIRINGKWEKMALELTGRPLAPAIGAPGASSLGDEEPTEDPETEEDTEERTEEEKDNTNDE